MVDKRESHAPVEATAGDHGCDKNQLFADALRELELDWIMGPDGERNGRDTLDSLWGLALSGGGIRSATYCLGVLQALTKRGLLGAFHYCSTVSGGGYIGGYLQAMLHHKALEQTLTQLLPSSEQPGADPSQTANAKRTRSSAISDSVLKLRSYSNFLSPNKRPLSGDRISMVSTYLSNMLLTQTQLGALVLTLAFLPTLSVLAQQWLGNAPVFTWLLAMACSVIALVSRPRERASDIADLARGGAAKGLSPGASIVPPMGLALSFVLLASLLWSGGDFDRYSAHFVATDSKRTAEDKAGFIYALSALFGRPVDSAEKAVEYFAPFAIASTYVMGFFTWLLWWWRDASKRGRFATRLTKQLVFGTAAAVAIGVTSYHLRDSSQGLAKGLVTSLHWEHSAGWLLPYLTVGLGAPVLFAVFYFINLLHLSLAYTGTDAVSRERWTRLMGRCGVWLVCGLTLPLLLAVCLPAYLRFGGARDSGSFLLTLWATISALGAGAGYWERATRVLPGIRETSKRILLAGALWVFIGGIVAMAGAVVLHLLRLQLGAGYRVEGFYGMAVALIVWLLLAYFIDENEFSMNGFYRNRLVRCYLAAARPQAMRDLETGLDPEGDDIKLNELRQPAASAADRQRPLYPLLCGAVNLVRSRRLEWQDRKAASFVFSPLFCGHQPLPHCQTVPIGDRIELPIARQGARALSPSPLAGQLTLGAAMSVSGAAVSPSMGYHSSPAVSVLLTLFNARLGWWVENRNAERHAANFAGLNLLSELVSNMHENGKYAYVTDGGHFENLGIYELIRRRCRFILAVDATADPERGFGDLANAVHKCRVDFGAEIDIDTTLMQTPSGATGHTRRCAALGKITYRDGEQGVLLYLKPSLLGDESADIRNYAKANARFPHQPTSDQFFDEIQFECYRQLGFQNMLSLFERDSTSPSHQDGRIGLDSVEAKEKFVKLMTYRLYEPSDAVSVSRARYGSELLRLLEKQRTIGALACLDHQMNPGLVSADPNALALAQKPLDLSLPPPPHFRDCYYFVQEIIQLMESVYNDLDLERNWNHPDNRGWMNQFRHWTWVPMFRLVWSLTVQSRSGRFVQFCEARLDMPKMAQTQFMRVLWQEPDRPADLPLAKRLELQSKELYRQGRINQLEAGLMCSPAVQGSLSSAADYRLGILTFLRSQFLQTGLHFDCAIPDIGVGVVLLTTRPGAMSEHKGETLVTMRVQDHLRRMGLGLAFMHNIVAQGCTIDEVLIANGNYGHVLQELSKSAAAKHQRRLQRFLVQARLMANKPQS